MGGSFKRSSNTARPQPSDGELLSPFDGAIANAIPAGIAIADASGKLLFVNSELLRLTGYADDELVGQSVDIFLPERSREQHVLERQQYALAPETRFMGAGRELYARRRDGSEFPVEVGLRPMKTALGPAILASVIDVTERRQLESGFRTIVDAAPYGILLVDGAGRLTHVNDSLCKLFGYQRNELLDQSLSMLVPERHRSAHAGLIGGYFANPTPRSMGSGRDLTGLRKDGVEFPIEIALSMVETAHGRRAVAAIIDNTQRKRAERQLREANLQLEEFTYVSSHDLRSPVRGIQSLIDFIKEDLGSDAPASVMNNLDRMRDRVTRMENLIDDLLSYARAAQRTASHESIDLHALIGDIGKLHPLPENMRLVLDIQVPPFVGARTPLATALRNLYSNAIKHSDAQSTTLTVRGRIEQDFYIIDIQDDGPGIPEEAHSRVFRLFQTLTHSQRHGTGLGLAVTKRLIESHGGRIELISATDRRGCIFRVWWPRFIRSEFDE